MDNFLGYKLVRRLGEGGMGTVYLVTDGKSRSFALKTVKPDIASSDEFRKRFLREGRIAVRMKHDRLVGTFEAGESPDGVLYMLTEFCPNGDVDHWIEKHPKAPLPIALQWTYDIALALDYVDSQHIIHRDLKPQNMLLDSGFRAKLGDVGCARGTTEDATRLTEDGRIQGTPYYLSPEQATGTDDLDIRSDLYALGVTLYQMLAGAVVFTGSTIAQILIKHMRETPEPLGRHRPDLPPSVIHLTHSLLEKDRTKRPASAKALADSIRSVALSLSIPLYDGPIPEAEFRRLSGDSETNIKSKPLDAQTLNAALGATLKYDVRGAGLDDTVGAEPESFDETAIAATLKYDDDAFADTQTAHGLPAAILDGQPSITGPVEIEPAAAFKPNAIEYLPLNAPLWPSGKAWLTVNLPSGLICQIAVYLSTTVRFGRKRNAEVDYSARLYPTDQRKDDIMRISNNHGRFDFNGKDWVVKDDGSRTGIVVNGRPVAKDGTAPLPGESTIVIASILNLATNDIRLGADGQPDALTIRRDRKSVV